MTSIEQLLVEWIRASDAYHEACEAYRKHVGRHDLDQNTPEEQMWWDTNVLPAMKAQWPLDNRLQEEARKLLARGEDTSDVAQP